MRNTWAVFITPSILLPPIIPAGQEVSPHYTGRPRSQSTFSVHVKMLSLAVIIQMSTKQDQDLEVVLPLSQTNGAKSPAVKWFDTKTQPTEYKFQR